MLKVPFAIVLAFQACAPRAQRVILALDQMDGARVNSQPLAPTAPAAQRAVSLTNKILPAATFFEPLRRNAEKLKNFHASQAILNPSNVQRYSEAPH
jgi:hypothetical protein